MKLSVIITAYYNNDMVKAHVRECMNSTLVPDEIIVVNDGGPDDLKEKLLSLKRNTTIVYAKIKEDIPWNYTGARNLGFWLARGDYISQEDADNIPGKDAYKMAVEFLDNNPNTGRIIYGRRPKVYPEDLEKPIGEWRLDRGARPSHQDTQMLRRETILKVKGCDERFAGRYAWACADWRRRLLRAGIESSRVTGSFYAVTAEKESKLERKPSYKNYELAREDDGHTQSSKGILNFTYEFEVLR